MMLPYIVVLIIEDHEAEEVQMDVLFIMIVMIVQDYFFGILVYFCMGCMFLLYHLVSGELWL